MKMNPRGERNAPYIDKGEMQILSRIDAAFAETPSAGHPEDKKLNDINAARNTFSAVISEIPKCASILQSIKREYDRWVLPPDEPESENCGQHPKVRRNAKKMAEDVRQATVSAASPPSMIPPREISTQVRLDKTKTKSHSYENTKRTFADDKKAQRLQAKPEVPYSRKDVLELEHWVEKRLGEMPDDVIDIDGDVSVLSECNAQIIKAVEYVDPIVARNTSMAWASMYDMMRIAKQDIESQRERQKLGTGLWTEEENDLRDQMRSAVQQKENAQKMVDDAKNEINEMKSRLIRLQEKQRMMVNMETVLEQRISECMQSKHMPANVLDSTQDDFYIQTNFDDGASSSSGIGCFDDDGSNKSDFGEQLGFHDFGVSAGDIGASDGDDNDDIGESYFEAVSNTP